MTSTERKSRLRKNIGVLYDPDIGAFVQNLYGEENTSGGELHFLKKNLRMCIEEELSARQREILVMYYYQGFSMASIAEHLCVNKSTVSRTRKRAVEKLRKCLKYGAARLLRSGDEEMRR